MDTLSPAVFENLTAMRWPVGFRKEKNTGKIVPCRNSDSRAEWSQWIDIEGKTYKHVPTSENPGGFEPDDDPELDVEPETLRKFLAEWLADDQAMSEAMKKYRIKNPDYETHPLRRILGVVGWDFYTLTGGLGMPSWNSRWIRWTDDLGFVNEYLLLADDAAVLLVFELDSFNESGKVFGKLHPRRDPHEWPEGIIDLADWLELGD